jgi:GT2 family glycosyltransferase
MSHQSIDLATVELCGPASNGRLAAILASEAAGPRYILLLSHGARALPGAVAALREALDNRPAAGGAGGLVLDERGRFVASHAAFPSLGHELLAATGIARRLYGPWFPSRSLADSAEACAADWVSGACLLVRREALAAVGLFDPQLSEADALIDWCFRLRRAAWELLYVPSAVVVWDAARVPTAHGQLAERYRSRVRLLRRLHGPAAASALKVALAALAALGRLQPLSPRQLRLALKDA